MSLGVMLLLGALTLVGAFIGLQVWMVQKMKANVGKEAPSLNGLGDPEGRIVWFYGPSCAPCHAMRPDVDALGDNAIPVDISRHMEVAMAYGVMATPTSVLVRDGRIVEMRPGRLSRGQLEELLAA